MTERPDALRRILDSEVARRAGEKLDMGALALALWLTDKVGGVIMAHVRFARGEGLPAMQGIQLYYQEYSESGYGRADCWTSRGNFELPKRALEGHSAGYDSLVDQHIEIHPSNVRAFLGEAGLPPIDLDLLDALTAGERILSSNGAEVIAGLSTNTPVRVDLSEAGFDNPIVLIRALTGARDPEVRRQVIAAAPTSVDLVKIAIEHDNAEVVAEMLDHGCSLEMVYFGDVSQPELIHLASASPKVTELLLARGVYPSTHNKNRETPLHTARHPDVTRALLAASCRIDAEDKNDEVPLHHALRASASRSRGNDCRHCVEVLLDAGADPFYVAEYAGRDYLTPFQLAVKSGWVRQVEGIIDRFPVDLGQRTLGGKTLAQLASKDADMKALLRSAKAGMGIQKSIEAGASDDNGSSRSSPAPSAGAL